jgi:hypothetical protein
MRVELWRHLQVLPMAQPIPQSWRPNLGELALFPDSPSQAPLPRIAPSRLSTVSSSSNKAILAFPRPEKRSYAVAALFLL